MVVQAQKFFETYKALIASLRQRQTYKAGPAQEFVRGCGFDSPAFRSDLDHLAVVPTQVDGN